MKKLILPICAVLLLSSCGVSSELQSEPKYEYEVVVLNVDDYKQFSGVVKVTNTGDCNIRTNGMTKFEIEDDSGKLLGFDEDHVIASPPIIKPGEVGYISQWSPHDTSLSDSGKYNLVPYFDNFESTDEEPVMFEVKDVSMTTDSYDPQVIARVVNDTNEEQEVMVQCVFYDSDDSILGVYAYITELGANKTESVGFDTFCISNKAAISHYDVTAMKK